MLMVALGVGRSGEGGAGGALAWPEYSRHRRQIIIIGPKLI